MTVFLSDAFTDTDGTFLPTHDGSWEELPWDITGGATTERHVIDTNHVRSAAVQTPGAQVLRWTGDPGADEYDLTATFSFHSTAQANRWHALFLRMTPSVTAYGSVDHYRVFGAANLDWQLDKIVGGTATLLDSFAQATAGTVQVVRVEVRSTGINVFLDNVLSMSTTDTAITQRGRVGIACRRGSVGGTHWLDDVIGDSVGAGGITGSGTVSAPAATISGAGSVTIAGSGSVTAPAAQVSGAGSVTVAGTGQVDAPAATVAGAGAVTVAGTGGLTPPAATVAGTAGVTVTGTGSVTAPAATLTGTGNIGTPAITGSGTVQASAATITGAGTVTVTGGGTYASPPATIAGTGTVIVGGTGTVTAAASTLAGAGSVIVTGTGTFTAPAAVISGSEDPPPPIPDVLTLAAVPNPLTLRNLTPVLALTIVEDE